MILYMKQKMIMMIIKQRGVINIKIYNLCYNVFNILDENISTNDDFSDKSEINININDPLINNIKRTNLSTNDEIICRYDISYTRYNHSKKLKYIYNKQNT